MFSKHASGKDEGEDWRAEHDCRAVSQWHVLDGIEHGEEKESSEHTLHHSSNADSNRAEKHLGRPCSGPPALIDTHGEHEYELKTNKMKKITD